VYATLGVSGFSRSLRVPTFFPPSLYMSRRHGRPRGFIERSKPSVPCAPQFGKTTTTTTTTTMATTVARSVNKKRVRAANGAGRTVHVSHFLGTIRPATIAYFSYLYREDTASIGGGMDGWMYGGMSGKLDAAVFGRSDTRFQFKKVPTDNRRYDETKLRPSIAYNVHAFWGILAIIVSISRVLSFRFLSFCSKFVLFFLLYRSNHVPNVFRAERTDVSTTSPWSRRYVYQNTRKRRP